MNPYAAYLGSNDALETIGETPQRLTSLLSAIGSGAGRAPAPGKWSAREIVVHLADCELVFAFRLRQAVAEDNPVVQSFDQEKWAAQYDAYDLATAMQAFAALRQWNLAFIRSLAPEALQRNMTHPERGEMTFQTLLETIGGHDRNHLEQLERIAGS
ncbi:MAG TPA: DinB family protein [Bryobacteraceae bacterium]|jgi:uncharacterized damage-inducible protein DinB|nr:DinB family protein [Bryobacteraceae bacterium]